MAFRRNGFSASWQFGEMTIRRYDNYIQSMIPIFGQLAIRRVDNLLTLQQIRRNGFSAKWQFGDMTIRRNDTTRQKDSSSWYLENGRPTYCNRFGSSLHSSARDGATVVLTLHPDRMSTGLHTRKDWSLAIRFRDKFSSALLASLSL
jgi:hypothetical protein